MLAIVRVSRFAFAEPGDGGGGERSGRNRGLTENQQTVARLRSESEQPVRRPPSGLGKGSILYMAPDFDESLDEMKEYME